MSGERKIHLDILPPRQRALLPWLEFLRREYGFYLAGGTALALQIGHRTSVDLDFYAPTDFDPNGLYKKLERRLQFVSPVHQATGTLIASVREVGLSFFRYEYPLLRPLVRSEHLDLSSLEDIAAMKVIAVVQRGTRRDFVDLYYLLKRIKLESVLAMTERKYAAFNRYVGLRALAYFEDADRDKSRRGLHTFEKIEWGRIKQEICEAVERYQRERLPLR